MHSWSRHIRQVGWLAQSCEGIARTEVAGSIPTTPTHFTNNHKPVTRCHVATHVWATWHHNIFQYHAMCQPLNGPPVSVVPFHLSSLSSPYPTTCHHMDDPDLCRNTMKYRNTHKCRDAVEIRLHFIND
jgi:hypothetical protein